MLCEICGEKKATAKVDMDGMELAVCGGCKRFGTEVVPEEKPAASGPAAMPREDVLPDYARRIRRAREGKDLSLEDLARAIAEKRSVLAKVESGSMLPDDRLANKLEKFLDIRVRGAVGGPVPETKGRKLPEATLGDIAEVKVKQGSH